MSEPIADQDQQYPDPSFPTNQYLKSLRDQADLTQQQLSERTGIGLFLIDSIERNLVEASNVLPLGKISKWKHCCNSELKRTQTKLMIAELSNGWSFLKVFLHEPFKKAFLLCFLAAFIVANFALMGNAKMLDRMIAVTFVIVALLGRNNPQILITSLILSCVLVVGDILFNHIDSFTPEMIASLYTICAFVMLKLRHDSMFTLSVIALMMCVGAEIYWYATGYDSPIMLWYIALITINLVVRYAIEYKSVFVQTKYTNFKENNKLNHYVLQFHGYTIILLSLMVTEYLLRHILHFETYFVYGAYSYVSQTIDVIYFLVMANELKRTTLKQPVAA